MTTTWSHRTTMETIEKERANPPFDTRKMAIALHGSERDLLLKEKFMLEIARDPAFRVDDIYDLSKDEIRERTMSKFANLVHYVTSENLDAFQRRIEIIGIADPGFWTRFGVHYGLFLGAVRSAATPNQFSYWTQKGVIGLNGVIGCFGMTELAHGSNVAGLETTATFDERSDEFIIHTPNLGATKWWIGGAASTATHCAVFAQLLIKGKKHGVKTFIVPLRDPKTFSLLPGVTIGDIGKKMGRDGIDNGYIQFCYVRIPRQYMLMKHTQVTREGEVREPPLAQLTYGALLSGRTAMVADSGNTAKKALTIAVRYAAVRRQFKTGNQEIETQILDYPIHQRRLMPLLSQAIAMGFTALEMRRLFEDMSDALESLEPGDPNLPEVLEKLKETHATSAGLKAFCTWSTLETIDKCRQACGGHGYSSYNGFPSMYADFAVQCTWEGDNTILALQSGRSLIQAYQDAAKGKKLASGVAYLNDLDRVLADKAPSDPAQLDSLDSLDRGWATVAANTLKKAAGDYEARLKAGQTREQAFEECSTVRYVAADVHTRGYIFRQFRAAVERLEKGTDGVREQLEMVCKLYALWQIEEKAAFFLKYGYINAKQLDIVQAKVDEYCLALRKIAIPMVDAFTYTDHILNSPIGRYDGDIYAAYFNAVRANNPPQKIHPYFDRLIKPLLEREPIEVEDFAEIGLDEEIDEIREEQEAAKNESKE